MTDFDELVLSLTLPKVKAWERLHNPEYCGALTMGQLYDLMLAAGYSEEEAQKAASRRGAERLDAGVVM